MDKAHKQYLKTRRDIDLWLEEAIKNIKSQSQLLEDTESKDMTLEEVLTGLSIEDLKEQVRSIKAIREAALTELATNALIEFYHIVRPKLDQLEARGKEDMTRGHNSCPIKTPSSHSVHLNKVALNEFKIKQVESRAYILDYEYPKAYQEELSSYKAAIKRDQDL